MDSGRLRLSSVEFFREEGFRSWSRALIIWGASATLTLPQLSIPTRRAYVKGIAEWPVVPFHEFGLTSLVECGALQEGVFVRGVALKSFRRISDSHFPSALCLDGRGLC